MKIVEKKNLAQELKGSIKEMGVIEGVGKTSGKPYVAFAVTGKNGNQIMYFPSTQDLLRLGIVIDDAGQQAK